MTNQAYVIEHPEASRFSVDESATPTIPFNEIETELRNEGYNLGELSIEHVLVDAEMPLSAFKQHLDGYWRGEHWKLDGYEKYQAAAEAWADSYQGFFHQTNIRSLIGGQELLQGSVLGYPRTWPDVLPKRLRGMVEHYVRKNDSFQPPYFVITDPEYGDEVKSVLENLDCNVDTVTKNKPV